MNFINNTFLEAINFNGYDVHDTEYEVITCCAQYRLEYRQNSNHMLDSFQKIKNIERFYLAELDKSKQQLLCLSDEFYGEPLKTDVLKESDLAPNKPKCDLIIQGFAYSDTPKPFFNAAFEFCALDDNAIRTLAKKELSIHGARHWALKHNVDSIATKDFNSFYHLTEPSLAQKIDLKYELALGGENKISNDETILYNEVCYRNPIGKGWFNFDFFEALRKYEQPLPLYFHAPQILPNGVVLESPLFSKQTGSLNAIQMAQIAYPNAAAGFGIIHRSWSPRSAKTGTYDAKWLEERHPYYPKDFNDAYWNCAPEDQQFDFPDLMKPHYLIVDNLTPSAGRACIQLPNHNVILFTTLAQIEVPVIMQVDTIIFDNEAMTLKIIWRKAIPKVLEPNEVQVYFNDDPNLQLFV